MEGGAPAPDAESLMRSRYTAFVLERDAYLLATWHPDTRPANLSFTPGAKWLGLEVRHVSPPNDKEPDTAVVEFVARQRLPGCAAVRIHEQSRFVRINTYWVYVDGTDMISP
jgi:SEC-C motif-containing protein